MQTEIHLLGAGRVSRDGREVDSGAWRTAKTFDLLRVLALSAGRPVPIDTLMEQFWPAVAPAKAGTSLRTAACQIRKVLGPESLSRVGHGLMLRDAWVDAGAYRALAGRIESVLGTVHPAQVVALVREAEQLYAGDLDVVGSECGPLQEAWGSLRALRVQVLLDGAEAAGRCGDWRQALSFAQRAATIETSDRSTRALMQAWFAVGETGKPVEEFERLRRHLAQEFGIDPAPQTRALYLKVVSACTEWPPRESIVGRDEEVRRVVSAVMARMWGPPSPTGVIWLVGRPGSGREAVAREAARTLMIPLSGDTPETSDGITVELLPDQGKLTPGLAAMLRLRAETRERILLIPVSQAPASVIDGDDVVVPVPRLGSADFHRMVAFVLQGEPTERLDKDLYAASDGLPGLACRLARHRLETGDLTWTPTGVDTIPGTRRPSKVVMALLAVPFALVGLTTGATETETREVAVVEQRERVAV